MVVFIDTHTTSYRMFEIKSTHLESAQQNKTKTQFDSGNFPPLVNPAICGKKYNTAPVRIT